MSFNWILLTHERQITFYMRVIAIHAVFVTFEIEVARAAGWYIGWANLLARPVCPFLLIAIAIAIAATLVAALVVMLAIIRWYLFCLFPEGGYQICISIKQLLRSVRLIFYDGGRGIIYQLWFVECFNFWIKLISGCTQCFRKRNHSSL